jgi:prepilin-type N-terminal cleavage/methylation domain-containing protein
MQKTDSNKALQKGFTVVEVLLATVIFAILVVGLISAYSAVRKSYRISRQLNEIYTVLSACPEIDRALEFTSLTSGTNCYPNNQFQAEGGGTGLITYTPSLTVTNTENLSLTDPIRSVPDSKVIFVSTGYALDSNANDLQLRLLITRNGVAQQ